MPEVIFNGPEGRLEGRFSQNKTARAPIALILHPLPQLGGNMNNPVTYQLYHQFVSRGFSVLRFNFRGIGRSQGEFDNGAGELSDAAAAWTGCKPCRRTPKNVGSRAIVSALG